MENASKLYSAVVKGHLDEASAITQQLLQSGLDADTILQGQLIPAMKEVGDLFEAGEYYLPNLLLSAQVMKTIMDILKPEMKSSGVAPIGRVAIGTIKGDLHDIGKNLVATLLEGNGFEVFDLGVDVGAERFVAAAKEHNVDIIAISALLTTTMINMEAVVQSLRREGLGQKVKVIIGGAPITQSYADEIGAHGFNDNANGAVKLATNLLGR